MGETFCENMCGNLTAENSDQCDMCNDFDKQLKIDKADEKKCKEYREQFGPEWEDLQDNK